MVSGSYCRNVGAPSGVPGAGGGGTAVVGGAGAAEVAGAAVGVGATLTATTLVDGATLLTTVEATVLSTDVVEPLSIEVVDESADSIFLVSLQAVIATAARPIASARRRSVDCLPEPRVDFIGISLVRARRAFTP